MSLRVDVILKNQVVLVFLLLERLKQISTLKIAFEIQRVRLNLMKRLLVYNVRLAVTLQNHCWIKLPICLQLKATIDKLMLVSLVVFKERVLQFVALFALVAAFPLNLGSLKSQMVAFKFGEEFKIAKNAFRVDSILIWQQWIWFRKSLQSFYRRLGYSLLVWRSRWACIR